MAPTTAQLMAALSAKVDGVSAQVAALDARVSDLSKPALDSLQALARAANAYADGTGGGGSPAPAPTLPPPAPTPIPAPAFLPGVNLSVAEFNPSGNRLWTDYAYPNGDETNYYADKGFKCLRVPFLAHRLLDNGQPTDDLRVMGQIMGDCERRGLVTIPDMHQYGGMASGLIGRDKKATDDFASVWGRLAAEWKARPNVIFGLMNEPNAQSASEWLTGVNAAIAAIRAAGAGQMILVPGSYWDGAHSWTSTDNASVMLGVVDPAGNYAYEVHQYLDGDNSGTHYADSDVVKGKGGTVLRDVTEWAKANKKKLFLGEFGFSGTSNYMAEADAMLAFLTANKDVWLGYAAWAGGPWWPGDYAFRLDPLNGKDRPRMSVLTKHLS